MNATSKIEAQSLASAMAAAFAEIEGVTKSATGQVGQQKYKYADLGSVIDAIKPALIAHNLYFTQRPQPSDGGITVETVIGHAGGEELSLGSLFVPANKNDAQAYGSALTYARRYALVTAFGVPVEDDDGNAAARGQSNREVSPVAAPLSPADYAKFVQLVESTKSNIPLLMQAIGLPKTYTYEQLTRPQYDVAIEALSAKLAALAKRETNAKAEEPA